ncbi:MAG: ammonium transporter [Ruminococcus sp.]|nr:ammonium transporter [Ruminococcus sp.]
MLITWIKDSKPDVSMCLNESLAGLDMAEHGLRYNYADFASRNAYKKLKIM